MKSLLFLFFLCFSIPALAWNAMGHRIIGEIAYAHLTPQAKNKANQLINYLSDAYPYSSSFQTANAWADYLKEDSVRTFDSWHFYNQPFSMDSTPVEKPLPQNLLWAIQQSIGILENPRANQFEKAFFLRFLLHLTGDAHQPLHCINRFSKNFPQGDQGGNLFSLPYSDHNNLHAYWDAALGLFDQRCGFSSAKSRRASCFAQKIQTRYPENFFGAKANDIQPTDWINESNKIAQHFVYQTPEGQTLSPAYLQQGQEIVEQQIALAGYRLAHLLNRLLGQ